MRKFRFYYSFCFALAALCLLGCGKEEEETLTTVILIRHAEEANNDTTEFALSANGQERAQALAITLKDQKFDAIYSADDAKSLETVEPLALSHSIEASTFEKGDLGIANRIIQLHAGGTVLIVSDEEHIPQMLNQFIGTTEFETIPKYKYDNLYVVSILRKGVVSTVQMRYGDG